VSIIVANMDIGTADASDDDQFLFDVFVKLPQYQALIDENSNSSIILGRTGSGKSAIIRYVESDEENVLRIDPKSVSFDYVSNSDLIEKAEKIGVDLSIFYELLWKHIICVALIKKAFNITDEDKEISWFDRLKENFGLDKGKIDCVKYLQSWSKKFWIDIDMQVKEITDKIELQFKNGLSIGLGKTGINMSDSDKWEESQKIEVKHILQKVVSDIQMGQLSRVFQVINDIINRNKQKKYFILIDDLDLRWADSKVQNRLIRSLIETIKSFRKIRQLKIIVALRNDVYERVISDTMDSGFQQEKYDTYICRLNWSQKQIEDMISRRIAHLYKMKYTREKVAFGDVFSEEVRNLPSIQYVINRTLLRPRDAIAFVNACFAEASGQAKITPKVVQNAEFNYSRQRYAALVEEWQGLHPSISHVLSILKNRPEKFSFSDFLVTDFIESVILSIAIGGAGCASKDNIIKYCEAYVNNESKISNAGIVFSIASEIMALLYKTGAVGLKPIRAHPVQWAYVNNPTISPSQVTVDAEAWIHPMIWRAIGITPNQ
jgi:hypothetical protein